MKKLMHAILIWVFMLFGTFGPQGVWADEPWVKATESRENFLEFYRWIKSEYGNQSEQDSLIKFYLMSRSALGESTPVPMPFQTKDKEDRIAELVVGLNTHPHTKNEIKGKAKDAYKVAVEGKLDTSQRSASDFETAREMLEEAGFQMSDFKGDIKSLADNFEGVIQEFYVAYKRSDTYLDKHVVPKLKEIQDKQKTLLKGKLKKEPFVYYKKIKAGSFEANDFLMIGEKDKVLEPFSEGKVEAGVIIKKGTEVFGRDKYLSYSGKITEREMFDALKATGWNMKNLKKPDNLEKK